MTENNYAEGSLEWHAWGNGAAYQGTTGTYRDDPLSGEWAGDPTPADVIRQAWQDVMGPSWDTFEHGTDDDRDSDDAIVSAWEEGYYSL